MDKWEYHVAKIIHNPSEITDPNDHEHMQNIIDLLNQHGEERWELVQVIHSDDGIYYDDYFFKRKKIGA